MKHKKFAEMNEVKIVLDDEDKTPQSDTVEQKVETSKIIAYSPILKMGIIGGGILLLVVAVGSIISGGLNTLNTTSKIEPTAQQADDDKQADASNDPQKDKTLLALTTQSTALKNLRDLKVQATPTPTPTPTLTPIPTTRPQVISKSPPAPPRTYRETTTVQPRAAIRVQPRVAPQRTTSPIQSKPRQIASTSNRFTATPARGTSQTLSPQEQWQAIAEAGSFSAPISQEEPNKNLTSGIKGGIGEAPNSSDSVQTNNTSGKRVLVGTTTTGKLETPIAWASNSDESLNYLVRITKEVQASDGSVVIPANSYLVVQLTGNSNTDGIAQLSATSLLINADNDTIEKKLPQNAVRILGSNGEFLKAQTGRGSDVMGSIFSATIAGITKAAQIQNSPTSSITTSDGFSSTTSVNNGNRNVLAGFGEGAFGSILENIKSGNERRAQSLNGANKVFVIGAGQTVRIYINETVSI